MFTKEKMTEYNRTVAANKREADNDLLIEIEQHRGSWTREQYAAFLQTFYWEDFFTITFRSPRKEPYYAAKSIWSELAGYKSDMNVSRAFIVIEPFQSGDLHAHGLIAGNVRGWLPEMALPWDIWGRVFKRFGRSKVEACNSPEKVAMYCSKYILKQQSRVCDYYYFLGDKFAWENGLLN